jgi:hypothetical protein
MITRKLAWAVLMLAGVALTSRPASAQTEIVLGTSTQGVTFTGTGSSSAVSLDLGNCTLGSCTLSGVAFGEGLLSSAKGEYDITSLGNIDLELTNPATGLWTADTKADSIDFSYGPGGSLLTGVLNLLQFQQISPALSNGHDWYLTSANLDVTHSTLDVSPGMQMQLYFGNVPGYFNGLLGTGKAGSSEDTAFGHGTLIGTPEPASVLLLGAGFLFLAGILRVRSRRSLSS